MNLTDALDIILTAAGGGDSGSELYEAKRVMEAQLRHLRSKEEGTTPDDPNKIQEYQEYHYENVPDIGVAFNDTRVWVCFSGVSLFRAKVEGDRLLTEFHPPGGFKNKWNEKKFGSPQRDALEKMRMARKELEELRVKYEGDDT